MTHRKNPSSGPFSGSYSSPYLAPDPGELARLVAGSTMTRTPSWAHTSTSTTR